MKHPHKTSESSEFNLGKTPELRCTNLQTNLSCGECDSCHLVTKINDVKEWFFRTGDKTKKRFVLGLIDKTHSKDLLRNIVSLLHPLASKDFTYASSRTTPGLCDDFPTVSMDRALNRYDTEAKMSELWKWFAEASYWTKSQFLKMILNESESHLLCAILAECKKVIAELEQDLQADYEASSIDSSHYTYDTLDHPELELLTTARSEYEGIARDPFSLLDGETSFENYEHSELERPLTAAVTIDDTIQEDSGDESLNDDDTDLERLDFIHQLPVHLSKYILSMLDTTSLNNCICVSSVWRSFAEQVSREHLISQSIKEEVMLMQGSGAQGYNPKYAADIFVTVPNVHINSYNTVELDRKIPTYNRSESSFENAYSGFSTRKIVMEERNVYCGAYNVLVLSESSAHIKRNDPNRVIHTDGSQWITMGSNDNRLRFISVENGRDVGPVISGHAGTICCVKLDKNNHCVYSGSYDTSIRCWSLETGKCLKIFRGHRDTVLCMKLFDSRLISGGRDKCCKVWDIKTKKCLRTFKHKYAISAVAMSDELCISGCQGGTVKVWDVENGKLIKRLTGHQGEITAIQLDRWHIVTGSKDGYVLAWSTQGDHSRCLAALRHPKEVLCLEFMYLRVITGAADGKIRIWNIVTGHCLRIMRGNSHSDPINCLIAIDNRITLNTARTLIVLNFEPVEYDYFLASDRVPPRVQYSNYGEAPIRKLPYPYIRAQRMRSAGASNKKLVHKDEDNDIASSMLNLQIAHSGRSLSHKMMSSAKRIQSAPVRASTAGPRLQHKMPDFSQLDSTHVTARKAPASAPATLGKHRVSVAPSTGLNSDTVKGDKAKDSDDENEDGNNLGRRMSWGFENKFIPDLSTMSLSDTKALLHSQIRSKDGVVPPDFIYLAVNAIQAAMKPTEAAKNMEANRRTAQLSLIKRFARPNSGPSDIDPRTKVPVDQSLREQVKALVNQGIQTDQCNDAELLDKEELYHFVASTYATSSRSCSARTSQRSPASHHQRTLAASPHQRSLPASPTLNAVVTRPRTAPVVKVLSEVDQVSDQHANLGLKSMTRAMSAKSTRSGNRPSSQSESGVGAKCIRIRGDPVPMLMYSKELKEKIENMKQKRKDRTNSTLIQPPSADMPVSLGRVSEHNDPLRRNVAFKLRTHNQVQDQANNMMEIYKLQSEERQKKAEMKKRKAWHAKVKETIQADKQRLFQSKMAIAPTAIR